MLLIRSGEDSQWRIGNVVSPPLGLLSLAAFARRERPGFDTFQLEDERTHVRTAADWSAVVWAFRPDVIALSALTVELDDTHDLLASLDVVDRAVRDRFDLPG